MELSQAHKDNLQLCVDVCRFLRLDIGGVDLILENIGISWKTSGAHICEINSQPQMFTTFFRPLLIDIFGDERGKIPIYVVYDSTEVPILNESLFEAVRKIHKNCILIQDGKYILNGNVNKVPQSAFKITLKMLQDPSVGALVIAISKHTDISDGWPFSYCNYLLYEENDGAIPKMLLKDILTTLKPEHIFSNWQDFELTSVHTQLPSS